MSYLNKLLFTTINPLVLSLFRIVFGVFALLESIYFYRVHLIEDYILQPKVLFNYHFLPVSPFSEPVLQFILAAVLLSSVCIILGLFYRISIVTFFIGFSYFFLLDKSYYNNHLYLIALIALLLIFIPADNSLTLRKKKKKKPALSWHLYILQFQFVVVYFFGGLAKINTDWIVHHEPASSILRTNGSYSEALAAFIVYGGLLFDLVIGFLLIYRKTRVLGAIGVLIFSISNHLLFDDINIFPFFMMVSLVVFFDVDRWKFLSKYNNDSIKKTSVLLPNKTAITLLSVYVVVQLIMPLRHFLYGSNVDWTGEGQRFAWRMKIQSRRSNECRFAIFDLNAKTIYPVDIEKHIHPFQKEQMIYDPKMVLDFAHYLRKDAKENHQLTNVMVKAKINVKFNQRKSIEMVSPEVDLSREKWSFTSHNKWIKTLKD